MRIPSGLNISCFQRKSTSRRSDQFPRILRHLTVRIIIDSQYFHFHFYLQIDGASPDNKDIRNNLFNISGLRAKYPQCFIDQNGSYVFVGLFEQIETLLECDSLPIEVLNAHPEINTFTKVFSKQIADEPALTLDQPEKQEMVEGEELPKESVTPTDERGLEMTIDNDDEVGLKDEIVKMSEINIVEEKDPLAVVLSSPVMTQEEKCDESSLSGCLSQSTEELKYAPDIDCKEQVETMDALLKEHEETQSTLELKVQGEKFERIAEKAQKRRMMNIFKCC